MKVLVVHNFYGSAAPSGENAVVEAEIDLLRSRGHEVVEFFEYSDRIRDRGLRGLILGGLATPWNPFSKADLRRRLIKEQPEIMHVHNTFPLLSPSVFSAAAGLNTAVVFTLHNFRLFCSNGLALRDHSPCTLCLNSINPLPAVKYACYRNSRIATVPVASMIALHRMLGTWRRHVDAFITLSDFQEKLMTSFGLPKEKLSVKPNFYDARLEPLSWDIRAEKAVYIGRLSSEKGVHTLLDAWKEWGTDAPALEIIGDGPDRDRLEGLARNSPISSRISFTGHLPFDLAQQALRTARLAIVPSLFFEGFPMVVREAFALEVPVLASRIGSLTSIIADGSTGRLFSAGNSANLCKVAQDLWSDRPGLQRLATAARLVFEQQYNSAKGYTNLLQIYQEAIDRRKMSVPQQE